MPSMSCGTCNGGTNTQNTAEAQQLANTHNTMQHRGKPVAQTSSSNRRS